MKNPKYLHDNGIPHVLYQCYFDSDGIDVMTIKDIVEDSKSGKELCDKLNRVQSKHKWEVDRETSEKVRLKSFDPMGNVMYFTCEK